MRTCECNTYQQCFDECKTLLAQRGITVSYFYSELMFIETATDIVWQFQPHDDDFMPLSAWNHVRGDYTTFRLMRQLRQYDRYIKRYEHGEVHCSCLD